MNKAQLHGSQTAKNGFINEDEIVRKFNEWSKDEDAQKWLLIMKYDLTEIDYVTAVKLSGYKTDVQVQITIKLKTAIDIQNIQVKLVSNLRGFNQIDKRWVNTYAELWDIPETVSILLKQYSGELSPTLSKCRDKRRMFMDEFSKADQKLIISFLRKNQSLICIRYLKRARPIRCRVDVGSTKN